MESMKTDSIVIECTYPTGLTDQEWDKHKDTMKEFMNKKVKNGISYKVYRMAPKPAPIGA